MVDQSHKLSAYQMPVFQLTVRKKREDIIYMCILKIMLCNLVILIHVQCTSIKCVLMAHIDTRLSQHEGRRHRLGERIGREGGEGGEGGGGRGREGGRRERGEDKSSSAGRQ